MGWRHGPEFFPGQKAVAVFIQRLQCSRGVGQFGGVQSAVPIEIERSYDGRTVLAAGLRSARASVTRRAMVVLRWRAAVLSLGVSGGAKQSADCNEHG